ncbi:MAG TPA: hypothetical protein VFQ61_33010 [Polyangiaceae bacterium]|nr:hypothetical protein [Polyangiaceae bacterium]
MKRERAEHDTLLGELAAELRAAHVPEELAPGRHEALLLAALGPAGALAESRTESDAEAPASEEESAEAERLRVALEGRGTHPLAHIATLLQLGHAPPHVSELSLGRAERAAGLPRARITPLRWGAMGFATLAAAAGVVLWLQGVPTEASSEPSARWLRARSAASMFSVSTFSATMLSAAEVAGAELDGNRLDPKSPEPLNAEALDYTARVDRIFAARERDLRENWYRARGLP